MYEMLKYLLNGEYYSCVSAKPAVRKDQIQPTAFLKVNGVKENCVISLCSVKRLCLVLFCFFLSDEGASHNSQQNLYGGKVMQSKGPAQCR